MKLSFEQKIGLAFALALACLLAIGGVGLWSAGRSIATYQTADQAHEVVNQLDNTWIGILNAETATRGYAVTGDETWLKPYESGLKAVTSGRTRLRQLTADNPAQQKSLDELDPLLAKKLGWLASAVHERREHGAEAALKEASPSEDGEVMDKIRHLFATLEQTQRRLQNEDSARAQAKTHVMIELLVLGSAVSIALVGLASVIVRRDFRRRRQAEAERDRFFSLSRDLLCIADFDGYFKTLNPVWEELLGFSRKELMDRPYVELVHPDDREATEAEASKVADGGEVTFFENRFRCRDGSYRWLSWSARSALPERLIYATARDVTESKQAVLQIAQLNETLQHRAAELEAANKELEAFSYSVSHDLRAPLRHLDGFVDLLKRRSSAVLDDKSRQYLDCIAGSANQMGRLVDDLLSFSRMARSEMHQHRLSLTQLVGEVRADLRRDSQGRAIQWKIDPLPDVHGDAPMLRVALMNLLGNAVKYTRERSPAIIEVGAAANESEHTIFVRDNGVGFDMKYAGKLFGVFQRLHFDDEYEGTGIGLASVHRIILRHGGRTWAEGLEGKGATFYFTLPKVPEYHPGNGNS
jgi:PAS domain S-box-containing protein